MSPVEVFSAEAFCAVVFSVEGSERDNTSGKGFSREVNSDDEKAPHEGEFMRLLIAANRGLFASIRLLGEPSLLNFLLILALGIL